MAPAHLRGMAGTGRDDTLLRYTRAIHKPGDTAARMNVPFRCLWASCAGRTSSDTR